MPSRIPSYRPPRLRTASRRDDSTRPNAAARGYCDKAHKAWRKAVLTACNWQCVDCGRVAHGRDMHADHIVPISQGGGRYDVANGAARCISCHGRKTRQENGKNRTCELPALHAIQRRAIASEGNGY